MALRHAHMAVHSITSNNEQFLCNKVRKRTKIRNRYNQAPQMTQDTNEKVTTSQIDITNESLVSGLVISNNKPVCLMLQWNNRFCVSQHTLLDLLPSFNTTF